MFKQPDAQQGNFVSAYPVQKSIWKYFNPRGEEKSILAMVQKLCPNAAIVDLNETFFGYSLIYGPKDWAPGIQGSYQSGDDTFNIDESAAWLADRLIRPVPGVDKYQGPVSGQAPILKVQDIGNGYTQLYWGV
jgi:hypothetical protein